MTDVETQRVAIIGGGPAGLMAAEVLSFNKIGVDIYDAMPTFCRKFLMAGKSGLNITHTEEFSKFLERYPEADARLLKSVSDFGPYKIQQWMQTLGIDSFVGSTGRVFPEMMKASPLLRAWLARLSANGVEFFPRHRWQGWDEEGGLLFATETVEVAVLRVQPAATILALGGGSWSRLGSDGRWQEILAQNDVETSPFNASNCGFTVNWTDFFKEKFAGVPLKDIALSVEGQTTRGECVITHRGVEGGGVYTLSSTLRQQLERYGTACLTVDLKPGLKVADLVKRLSHPRGKKSMASHLRKTIGLTGVKAALLRECTIREVYDTPDALAQSIKSCSITITGTEHIDKAISTVGGLSWSALDDHYMIRDMPGVFTAGEMIDWDAPTGGYLLTACFATGRSAALGALKRLK